MAMNRPYHRIRTAQDVRDTADRLGSYFFSEGAMEFFQSRLQDLHRSLTTSDGTGTDTGLFVTSERFVPLYGDPEPRTFTVRRYVLTRDDQGRDSIDITTCEDGSQLPTRAAAERFMRDYQDEED